MSNQFSLSSEGPTQEDLINRGDRSQVGTDIGRTVQTLINSAIMQSNYTFDEAKTLYEDTGKVRELANLLSEVHIGPVITRYIGDGYDRYHEIVPDDVHALTNETGIIIAQLVDALVATKFHTHEQRVKMLNNLKKIGTEIKNFNSQANSMHTIAQVTTVEPNINKDHKHL